MKSSVLAMALTLSLSIIGGGKQLSKASRHGPNSDQLDGPINLPIDTQGVRDRRRKTVSREWSLDLRSMGYASPPGKNGKWEVGPAFRINPIGFIDEQTVAATFVTRQPVTSLARRDQPTQKRPLTLHAVFFDASDGQMRAAHEWPISEAKAGILPAPGGKIVVVTPDHLELYSKGIEFIKRLNFLEGQPATSVLWALREAPAHRFIVLVLNPRPAFEKLRYELIDSDSLSVLQSWSEDDGSEIMSVSDSQFLVHRVQWPGEKQPTLGTSQGGDLQNSVATILIQRFNESGREICRARIGQGCGGWLRFISDCLFAEFSPHGLEMFDTQGSRVSSAQFRADDWIDWQEAAFCADCEPNKLALPVMAQKGGDAFLDVDPHAKLKRIDLITAPNSEVVNSLDASRLPSAQLSGVALSPTGSTTAVITSGFITLFRLRN